MRYRFIVSIGAVMALLAVWHVKPAHPARSTSPARAQALAHTPDLSGVWLVSRISARRVPRRETSDEPLGRGKVQSR